MILAVRRLRQGDACLRRAWATEFKVNFGSLGKDPLLGLKWVNSLLVQTFGAGRHTSVIQTLRQKYTGL